MCETQQGLFLERFKTFYASHNVSDLEGQIAIPVLGLMGAGKSSLIRTQLGDSMRLEEDDFECVSSASGLRPKVSSGLVSQTLNVTIWDDPRTGFKYIDTAGLNEARGQEEKLWTQFQQRCLWALLKELRASIVMVNYQSTLGGNRCQALREWARHITAVFGGRSGIEVVKGSLIFVVTHAINKNGQQLLQSKVIEKVQEVIKAEVAKIKQFIKVFERQFPVEESSHLDAKMKNTGRKMVHWIPGVADSCIDDSNINWQKLETEKMESFEEYMETIAGIELLQSMTTSNTVISWPCDADAVDAQRSTLDGLIDQCEGVRKDKLVSLCEARGPKRLMSRAAEVCVEVLNQKTVTKTTGGVETRVSLKSLLKEQVAMLQKLHDDCDDDEQAARQTKMLSSDWEEVREEELTRIENLIAVLDSERDETKREIWELEHDKSLKPVEWQTVVIQRGWSLCGGAWGTRVLKMTKDPRKFESVITKWSQVAGKWYEHRECDEYHPSNGIVKFTFTSKIGFDVDVEVGFNLPHNQHPAIIDRIKELSDRLCVIDQSKKAESGRLREVSCVPSGEKLLQLLDANRFKIICDYIANKTLLAQEVGDVKQDGKKPSEEMTLRGLDKLLKVTLNDDSRKKFFFPDQSVINTVEEYMQMRQTIQQLEPKQERIMNKFNKKCPTSNDDFMLDTDVQFVAGKRSKVEETCSDDGSDHSTAPSGRVDGSIGRPDSVYGLDWSIENTQDPEFLHLLSKLQISDKKIALQKQGIDQITMVQEVDEESFLEAATLAELPKLKAKALYNACRDALQLQASAS